MMGQKQSRDLLRALVQRQTAEDGTQKLRLRCSDGVLEETVLIPDDERDKSTQCLSTQLGCGLGCRSFHVPQKVL